MTVQEEKKPCTSNEYVDLGLPSGLKWAKCNVGAATETEYGDYFMWGSTKPSIADECTWAKAPFNNGDSYYNADAFKLVKNTVCPNGVLGKEYDAASQIMGGGWRMPTQDELQELLNNTTKEWTQVDGVNGFKFTGSNGNSIFIPAAGNCGNGSVDGVGKYGRVWSSSLSTSHHSYAWNLGFLSGYCSMGDYVFRYGGLSVRGVMK